MIGHDRARALAATAVDFPLVAAERRDLDAHLHACTACRGAASDYASDAARLAALPVLPWDRDRVRARGLPSRLAAVAAAALVVALTLAALAAVGAMVDRGRPESWQPPVGWRPVTDEDLVFPGKWSYLRGVIAGGPGAIAWGSQIGGRPVVVTTTDGIDWSLARFDEGPLTDIQGLTPGGSGYVAVGTYNAAPPDEQYRGIAWTSVDAQTWRRIPDDPSFDDAQMDSVVALGDSLVTIGHHMSGAMDAIAWSSRNGTTWTLLPLALPPGIGQIADPVVAQGRIWAAGWQPIVAEGDRTGPPVLLSTTDGARWDLEPAPLIGTIRVVNDEVYALVNARTNLVPMSYRIFEPAGSASPGVYRLAGGSWQPVSTDLDRVGVDLVGIGEELVMVGHRSDCDVVCDPAPSAGGVADGDDCRMTCPPLGWRSRDGGRTWSEVGFEAGPGSPVALAGLPDGTALAVGSIPDSVARYRAAAWASTAADGGPGER